MAGEIHQVKIRRRRLGALAWFSAAATFVGIRQRNGREGFAMPAGGAATTGGSGGQWGDADGDSPSTKASASPTAEAWLLAARRAAEGRADAAAYFEAAWYGTEAWWLRPIAYLVAIGLSVQAGARRWADEEQTSLSTASQTSETSKQPKLIAADGAAILRSLQNLESRFFGTSIVWEERPYEGFRVRGNLRKPKWAAADLEEVRRTVNAALGRRGVYVHVLRSPEAEQDETLHNFDLFVRDGPRVASSSSTTGVELALALATLFATTGLGSDTFEQVGSVVSRGSSAPIGLLFSLVFVAEAARALTAQRLRVELDTVPALLPSPQLGILGAFRCPRTPASSRTSALVLALAAPAAMAAASMLLIVLSLFGASSVDEVAGVMDLHEVATRAAWPLALLPDRHCEAMLYAGVQGLLIASLSLLPQSPDGKVAWACLHGRSYAGKIGEVASYLWPLLGFALEWFSGPNWPMFALWWSVLLVNFAPPQDRNQPPLEEFSPIHPALRIGGHFALGCAVLCTLPLPLHLVVQTLSPLAAPGGIASLAASAPPEMW